LSDTPGRAGPAAAVLPISARLRQRTRREEHGSNGRPVVPEVGEQLRPPAEQRHELAKCESRCARGDERVAGDADPAQELRRLVRRRPVTDPDRYQPGLTDGQGEVPPNRDAVIGKPSEAVIPEAERGQAARNVSRLLGAELAPERAVWRELEEARVNGGRLDRVTKVERSICQRLRAAGR